MTLKLAFLDLIFAKSSTDTSIVNFNFCILIFANANRIRDEKYALYGIIAVHSMGLIQPHQYRLGYVHVEFGDERQFSLAQHNSIV